MFTVTKEVQFDAGHRVPRHESKCRNPHGHRYRVVMEVSSDEVQTEGAATGMVLDFGDLKQILNEYVHDKYDHGFIIWEGDHALRDAFEDQAAQGDLWKIIVVPFHPTAENLAQDIFLTLRDELEITHGRLHLESVTVWETPTSSAMVCG